MYTSIGFVKKVEDFSSSETRFPQKGKNELTYFFVIESNWNSSIMLNKETGMGCSRELKRIFWMWKVHETLPLAQVLFWLKRLRFY